MAQDPGAPAVPRADGARRTVLVAIGACFVLMTSLGGVTYPWAWWQIVGCGVLGVVLLGAFLVIERRAAEPALPLRLFRSRTSPLPRTPPHTPQPPDLAK